MIAPAINAIPYVGEVVQALLNQTIYPYTAAITGFLGRIPIIAWLIHRLLESAMLSNALRLWEVTVTIVIIAGIIHYLWSTHVRNDLGRKLGWKKSPIIKSFQ